MPASVKRPFSSCIQLTHNFLSAPPNGMMVCTTHLLCTQLLGPPWPNTAAISLILTLVEGLASHLKASTQLDTVTMLYAAWWFHLSSWSSTTPRHLCNCFTLMTNPCSTRGRHGATCDL